MRFEQNVEQTLESDKVSTNPDLGLIDLAGKLDPGLNEPLEPFARLFQIQRYGYFVMDRTKDGWIGTAFSIDDQIMGSCSFTGRRQASCLVSPNLPEQLPASRGLIE